MSRARTATAESLCSLTPSELSDGTSAILDSVDVPFVDTEHISNDASLPLLEASTFSLSDDQFDDSHFISTLASHDEVEELPTAQAEEMVSPEVMRMRSLSNASCLSHEAQACLRPEFISVTAVKATPDAKLGLSFKTTRAEGTFITLIADYSPYRRHFQPGDRIVSVNTINCLLVSKDDIAELIRSIPNSVTIVVHCKGGDPFTVSSTIHKPANTRAKISLGTKRGALTVTKVDAASPFCNSLLVPSHRVMSINGISCQGMPPVEAAEKLKREETITIISRLRADHASVIACGIHKQWWKEVATAAGVAAAAFAISR